ncbi:hypothetical protein [Flavobacterium sediminis]|uniref:hypothetical protein n=1 Tax=Flavobacterium sediminis TaxID=2201181 RepID=UPI0011B227FA|nr:hypothetical protein [Flavobacterium sediminis]
MKKSYLLSVICLAGFACVHAQVSGVGINETVPEQALHLGSPTGTIRVEGLNETNNEFNGGGTNTYPLFVDDQGSLTLEFRSLYNSEGSDALNPATLPESVVYLPGGDEDGVEVAELFSFTINTNSLALLEVKYSISFEVFQNLAEDVLTDMAARRVNTYFMLDGLSRQFGHASKCYTGGSRDSKTGLMYNTSTTYITLPAAGSYTIRFFGEVSSGITASTSFTGKETCVKFARGNDSLLFRLH